MGKNFIIIVVTFALLGGFLVYQSTSKEASLVLLPSQLEAQAEEISEHRVRVGGRVAALPISYEVEPQLELRFSIHDPGGAEPVVPVVYQGLKPDMFAPGRDVIIDGRFHNGTLVASALMTQCPSKYEPPDPSTKDYSKTANSEQQSL